MRRSLFQTLRLFAQLLVMAPPLLLWQCARHPLRVFLWVVTLPPGFIILRVSVVILALYGLGWGLQSTRPGLVTVVVLSTAVGLWPVLFGKGSLARAMALHANVPFPMPVKLLEIWHRRSPVAVVPADAVDLATTLPLRFENGPPPSPLPTLSVAEARAALPDHLKALLTD